MNVFGPNAVLVMTMMTIIVMMVMIEAGDRSKHRGRGWRESDKKADLFVQCVWI